LSYFGSGSFDFSRYFFASNENLPSQKEDETRTPHNHFRGQEVGNKVSPPVTLKTKFLPNQVFETKLLVLSITMT